MGKHLNVRAEDVYLVQALRFVVLRHQGQTTTARKARVGLEGTRVLFRNGTLSARGSRQLGVEGKGPLQMVCTAICWL